MMNNHHTPVLLNETLKYLITDKSGCYFDGTLGFGGHAEAILNQISANAMLIATDVDNDAFEFSKMKFENEKRIKIYKFNFSQIDIIAKIENVHSFNGVFADLGVSSFQLDNPGSGFTYRVNAMLDLRMDKTIKSSAADILNYF